ncbi:MAG: hypothetical protein KC653_00660 [Candidatus Andersenbacteria bacterium]|nr:hypothetical protein [Candidatus Andersenbacteria bacterium]
MEKPQRMIVYDQNGNPVYPPYPYEQPVYYITPQQQFQQPLQHSIQQRKTRNERQHGKYRTKWGIASKGMLYFCLSWIPVSLGFPMLTFLAWFLVIVWAIREAERRD